MGEQVAAGQLGLGRLLVTAPVLHLALGRQGCGGRLGVSTEQGFKGGWAGGRQPGQPAGEG